MRRTAHTHMHSSDTKLPQGFHPCPDGCAPDDRVFDDDDILAPEQFFDGIELHAHAEVAHALGGLDEGAADIMVAHQPQLERGARGPRVAQRRVEARVGHREELLDLLRGDVYALEAFESDTEETKFKGLPLADYPMAIAERGELDLMT